MIEIVGHRGMHLGELQVGVMDADFIRGPTVIEIVDHNLRDPNARHPLKTSRVAFDLLDMRVSDDYRHECLRTSSRRFDILYGVSDEHATFLLWLALHLPLS